MASHEACLSNENDTPPVLLAPPLALQAPPPEEQRAIVLALDDDDDAESHYVYSVAKSWYQKWRIYVGMPDDSEMTSAEDVCGCSEGGAYSKLERKSTDTTTRCVLNSNAKLRHLLSCSSSPSKRRNQLIDHVKTTSTSADDCRAFDQESNIAAERSAFPNSLPPPPIEMNLIDDDENIYVDESVWKCWVLWYGIADTHELDRRNWASDDKDFEICILSPYCGLIENPVKTFDISDECGYIEIQLRRIFKVMKSRNTRLWICEKARQARFQPVLNRYQEMCFQDCLDQSKNYILALEVANIDSTWPTQVPGKPTGSFDRYSSLFESGSQYTSTMWESELKEALDTVFAGISSELKETASGILNTTKCVVAIKEEDIEKVKVDLQVRTGEVEDRHTKLDARLECLRLNQETLLTEQEKLKSDRDAFCEERQRFAEELVRMHTINKMQETRVKLNIGGHVFMTSTLTLTKEPDSMLAAMFSGRHSLKQEDDGSYFIDRDGTHFRHILNYLRDGAFRPGIISFEDGFLGELYTEAEYYQLGGLMKLLDMAMKLNATGGRERHSEGSPRSSTVGGLIPGPLSGGKRLQRKVAGQLKAEK